MQTLIAAALLLLGLLCFAFFYWITNRFDKI